MKTFEIITPELRRAIEDFDSATDGTIEASEARLRIAAGNGRVRTVGQELRVRLAMPKLAAAEAKLIEVEAAREQRQIATQAAA